MTDQCPPVQEDELAALRARLAQLESENGHLRAVLQAGRIGHFRIDPLTGDRSGYSPEYLILHGLVTGTAGETRVEWLAQVHPDDRARAEQDLSDAITSRSSDYCSEFRVLLREETAERRISARGGMQAANPLTGEAAHLAVAQHDVTQRRTAEDALRAQHRHDVFLLSLGDALRQLTDPIAVMAAAAEALGRYLGISRVGYGEIDAAGQTIHVERDWTDGTVSSLAGQSRPLVVFGPAIIDELHAGRTLRLDDIAADARSVPYAPGYASIGTRSLLVAPLIKDGRLTAVFYLHEPTARQWSDADAALVEEVAARTWSAVEQARAEAARSQSEGRFRAAVAAVNGVLWTNNAAGEMRDEQPGWAALTGQRFEEYQGYGWSKAVHPDDAEPTVDAWNQAVAERRPFVFEHRLRRHDGAWRHFAVRAIPVLDPDGTTREWVGVHTDITELRESAALKSAVLEAALDCIITIDQSGIIVEWNPAAERTFGHFRTAALGQNIADVIIPPEHRAAHHAGLARYLAIGEGLVLGRRIELEALRADGSRFPVELAITPISTGAQIYFTAYLRDIGERRQTEAALRASEGQFRAMADSIPQMAWMARSDGSRYWFNRRWYEYTGLPAEKAEGFGWQGIHHPDHLSRVLEGMHRAWATAEPWEDTFPLRGKDGEYRWFLTRAVPVHDAQGQVTLWFGTNTDVTERQAIEAALREESHTLEVLNRTGAALAAELDHTSIVQKVTDAATELSGAAFGAFFYSVVEKGKEALTLYTLSGAPREAFSKFPLPSKTAVFAPTFNGEGIIRSDDITADPRYGQNAPHRGMPEGHLPVRSYLAVPVVSRSGNVVGGLFFGHPEAGIFTERAERLVAGIAAQAAIALDNARLYQAAQHEVEARTVAEEELRQLNETLERLVEERTAALQVEVEERRRAEEAARQSEKLAAIGQLTGGIAHDFNNIVQVVASGATLLRFSGLTEERREVILDGLAKATESAKELTGRLLAFARKQTLQPEAFDLNERLAGMAEMLRHTLGSRIRVETDFCPELWPVMADQGQFEVAVLNLALNARDAMLPEGGTLTLTTRTITLEATAERAAGEYVCLAVKDTGKGMPPSVQARVFEPFFTTKGQAGTGLGLPQVHGFAKQSGGDIAIESVPGQGTTIFFHLPRAVLAPSPEAPRSNISFDARMERTAGKTVLVVDDNPDVASFAASMLEELGYTTRCATNAADALSLVADDETIDAVFSDVVMAGAMDGVQLASTLRLCHPHLAIVLATGYSQVLAEWRGKAVAEVLSKPYRLDDLAAALERALAGRAVGEGAG